MRASRLALLVSMAFAAAACSLLVDTSGYSGGAAPARDASADAPVASVDAAADADAGAGDGAADAACAPTKTVDSPFTSDLGSWVSEALGADGYPLVETIAGRSAAVLLPVRPEDVPDAAPTEVRHAHSGLWLPDPVPLASFDLDAEVFVQCTSSSSCADGLMIAWLDALDPQILETSGNGHIAGLPGGTGGAALVLDDYTNDSSETSDPPAPTVQIVKLDPAEPIGEYHWTVDYRTRDFLGSWHTVGLRVRGGSVTVRLDGADLFATAVSPVGSGLFGFTAGTGGESDAVAIRNVHAAFYACTP